MRFKATQDCAEHCGKMITEVMISVASKLMREGVQPRRAFFGPQTFQVVQQILVSQHDPSLRGEWDGNRFYLRMSLCGRELVINMDESVPEHTVEVEA
jgi:hypothetical protein